MSMSVKKRNTWFIRLFLFLSAAVGLSVWISAGNIEYTIVTSEDGIWDLRGVDLQNQSVRLAGDVEYVPGALLSSDEFAVADNIALGEIPDGTSYLTSRVRLLVPAGYLEIAGFADDFGSRVFLNGKQLTDSGSPAENHANNVPSERFIKFTAEPVDGIIRLVHTKTSRDSQRGSAFPIALISASISPCFWRICCYSLFYRATGLICGSRYYALRGWYVPA